MKPIGYLLAGVALFAEHAFGLDPAPNTGLPAGWRYKGCYTDKPWNYLTTPDPPNPKPGAVHGVATTATPRTLNGYFYRATTMGGVQCTTQCSALGFAFAATNNNQCWCDNAIAINGTSTITPAYGLPDGNNNNCQQACAGNAGEACGSNPAGFTTQRLSLYEYIVSCFLD